MAFSALDPMRPSESAVEDEAVLHMFYEGFLTYGEVLAGAPQWTTATQDQCCWHMKTARSDTCTGPEVVSCIHMSKPVGLGTELSLKKRHGQYNKGQNEPAYIRSTKGF